jgi:hypothetical protein
MSYLAGAERQARFLDGFNWLVSGDVNGGGIADFEVSVITAGTPQFHRK